MTPKNRRDQIRRNSFQAPKPPLYRRIFRFLFNPITLSIAVLLIFLFSITAAYFWFEFSDKIDLLLKGEIYTNTAGIYSSPKTLRTGEEISAENLVTYLKTAGYIEKNNQADVSRSRYSVNGNSVQIEPGNSAIIEKTKTFPSLNVIFKKDGKSIEKITDNDSEKDVERALIEPKILSSIVAEGDGRRKAVTFQDLPPHLIKAITVTEDRAFFEHYGINLRGILRALWRRYENEEDNSPIANQGGSSITQQLVKNLLLNRDQTLERKLREAYMSVILETRLTKEQIFTLYANQIYLGQQTGGISIYGVGEAANAYFGKDVSQLNLAESALIAAIIRSPNRYNPNKNIEKATERRNQVLDSMLETGTISRAEFEKARQTPIELRTISPQKDLQGMPYFSQYAAEQLPQVVNDPEALQHLRVYTTIDPDLQQIAYQTVNKRLEKLSKHFKNKTGLNAALISIRPKTGEIVAMVGGKNYLENQFNRAVSARRQPGSAFKPFVYAAAINSAYESGSSVYTAASFLRDEKKTFAFGTDTYSPNNYGDSFSNKEITLRDALVRSKNTVTVDLAMSLNISKIMNLANKAGFPKVEKAYPSMALGTAEATPLQVATGYTIFANLGEKVEPIAINRITTGDGRLVVEPKAERKRIVRPDVAYILTDMLKDVINRGTAYEAQAWGFKNQAGKRGFAGKTGTSRDGWFAGFTPEILTVVYVGFDDGSDLGMKGSDSAMPIWADFMRDALALYPELNGDWQMPETVYRAEIDTRNGLLIRELGFGQNESIKTQTEPSNANLNNVNTAPTPEFQTAEVNPPDVYVTNVPGEFRRVEYFVSGTVPSKAFVQTAEEKAGIESNPENPLPMPSPTPSDNPESDEKNLPNSRTNSNSTLRENEEPIEREVEVQICILTGMRANSHCPDTEMKTYLKGTEPKETCRFHIK